MVVWVSGENASGDLIMWISGRVLFGAFAPLRSPHYKV